MYIGSVFLDSVGAQACTVAMIFANFVQWPKDTDGGGVVEGMGHSSPCLSIIFTNSLVRCYFPISRSSRRRGRRIWGSSSSPVRMEVAEGCVDLGDWLLLDGDRERRSRPEASGIK